MYILFDFFVPLPTLFPLAEAAREPGVGRMEPVHLVEIRVHLHVPERIPDAAEARHELRATLAHNCQAGFRKAPSECLSTRTEYLSGVLVLTRRTDGLP